MPEYGLTPAGLVVKTLAIIKAEMQEAYQGVYGKYINLEDESNFGQEIAIHSEREHLLWELMEAIYDSQYPDTSEDSSLDNVGSITAITRLPATKSSVLVALFGTATTIIAVDTILSVENNPLAKFLTNSIVTLGVGVDAVQTIVASGTPTSGQFKLVYGTQETANIAYNALVAAIQAALNALEGLSEVIVSGAWPNFTVTFQGLDGKQPQVILANTDNTLQDGGGAVTLAHVTTVVGVYQATVQCDAEVVGPTVANAETLTNIDTPISGLTRVFNPEDATIGRLLETNAAYRIRRAERLQVSEAGPAEAIRAAILELNEVEGSVQIESAKVPENVYNVTDARGIPPKSFEAIVYQAGGSTARDQEIAEAIWFSKPAGILPHGDVSKTVTDSEGFQYISRFTRPDEIDIYCIFDLTVTAAYPTDGDDQVKAAVVAHGNALGVGVDVIVYPTLISELNNIPGIIDIVIKIGIAPAPTLDNNIPIDDGTGSAVEISRWGTSRITVNS